VYKVFQRLLILFALIFGMTACESNEAATANMTSVENDNSQTGVAVYTHAQYQATTGCNVDPDLYERSLRQVLASVVFHDEPIDDTDLFGEKTEEQDYTFRHSREFFTPLMILSEQGSNCAMDDLVALAKQAGYPEQSDIERSTDVFTPAWKRATEPVKPYYLMTRTQYTDQTNCPISKSTYKRYIAGFFNQLLHRSITSSDQASAPIRQFLQQAGEGKHTAKNTLDPVCLTPTMKRIAKESRLLNAAGEFKLQ